MAYIGHPTPANSYAEAYGKARLVEIRQQPLDTVRPGEQRWHDTMIVFQGFNPEIASDVSARCFLTETNSDNSLFWNEVQLEGVPLGYVWAYPAIDQDSDKVFFEQGYTENDQLVMKVLMGRMTGRVVVRDATERKWSEDKRSLFGEPLPNVSLTDPGKRERLSGLGRGLINGHVLYVPYCLDSKVITYRGKSQINEKGPDSNGVLHSIDSGLTWQIERISGAPAALPKMSRTKGYYYYFAATFAPKVAEGWELWFSRKLVNGGSWDLPKPVTKTFGSSALIWKYEAIADEETVHVCWLDERHEKKRSNLVYPFRQNYEVVYRRRNDSDIDWSEDAILSKGFLYSYSPTMSLEGDRIVVAWAGIRTAPDWHTDGSPNDIYYVTSKDGGKTWAKPLKVTDGAKDGMTSGKPQVMLLNGVIHLFYIQGQMKSKQESPGLTKLNQPPWPIYYAQRPFPK